MYRKKGKENYTVIKIQCCTCPIIKAKVKNMNKHRPGEICTEQKGFYKISQYNSVCIQCHWLITILYVHLLI